MAACIPAGRVGEGGGWIYTSTFLLHSLSPTPPATVSVQPLCVAIAVLLRLFSMLCYGGVVLLEELQHLILDGLGSVLHVHVHV